MKRLPTLIFGIGLSSAWGLFAQTPQAHYTGTTVTGQLTLANYTVNLMQVSQNSLPPAGLNTADFVLGTPHKPYKRPTPPVQAGISSLTVASTPGLSVNTATSFGFNGLTHAQQRLANGGENWSTEPATPAVATGNGFIVQGVDNAIQIYNTTGSPLLPYVVTSNQLFGLPPACIPPGCDSSSSYGLFPGPYLTDMRVFFDPDIQRFIVLQWGQPQDNYGDNLAASTEWIAVTQTSDPTGVWNIYSMVTTDPGKSGCPCVPDYPQLGADQYALYVSSNEFDAATESEFFNSNILVISKADLAAGAASPSMVKFAVPNSSGYAFAIQPATTPPGASYFQANGGLEYFVSSRNGSSSGNSLSIWAMSNTSSIGSGANASPNILLTQTVVTTEAYIYPGNATQPSGPDPYGQSQYDPIPTLSGEPDCRILSLIYAGGRLYATMETEVSDGNGKSVVGGGYFILSPTFRANILAAPVLRQGYLAVNSNHILRPAAAVTAQGKGAIVFTLVGPGYYPSAAWLPINTTTTGSVVQLASAGAAPEDGFTGYPGEYNLFPSPARWGDNSSAVVAADGSIWGVTEYIPNLPRTSSANWGTYLMHVNP